MKAKILIATAFFCWLYRTRDWSTRRSGPLPPSTAELALHNPYDGSFETLRDSRLVGIGVVRLINTAESDYKKTHGTFATWDELYHSNAITSAAKGSTSMKGVALAFGPEVIPGWFLKITVSYRRDTYQISLRNGADKICGFSFFSDQQAVIYQGSVINCEQATFTPTK